MARYRRGDQVQVASPVALRGEVRRLGLVYEGEQYYHVRIPSHQVSHHLPESALVSEGMQRPTLWDSSEGVSNG